MFYFSIALSALFSRHRYSQGLLYQDHCNSVINHVTQVQKIFLPCPSVLLIQLCPQSNLESHTLHLNLFEVFWTNSISLGIGWRFQNVCYFLQIDLTFFISEKKLTIVFDISCLSAIISFSFFSSKISFFHSLIYLSRVLWQLLLIQIFNDFPLIFCNV